MSMNDYTPNGRSRSIDKWIALGIMNRTTAIRDMAEMLESSMEDLFHEMEEINTNLEALASATETIQDKLEEVVDIMNSSLYDDLDTDTKPVEDTDEFPF